MTPFSQELEMIETAARWLSTSTYAKIVYNCLRTSKKIITVDKETVYRRFINRFLHAVSVMISAISCDYACFKQLQ